MKYNRFVYGFVFGALITYAAYLLDRILGYL